MAASKTTEIARKIKPFVMRWINETVGGGVGAPSPHDLNSAHHSGALADSQAPQFLKTDGSRTLTGDLGVSDLVTIDGVDVSVLKSDHDTHIAATAHAGHMGGVGVHTHQSNPEGGQLSVSALTDHTKAAHDALGLSHDSLSDVSIDDHHNQVHALVGADHTASGLTAGHVIRATGTTTFAWQQLEHGDLGGVSANQHHNQVHDIAGSDHTGQLSHGSLSGVGANDHHNQVHGVVGADHTVTGAALDVVGLTATNTLGLLTPSADPGAASAILKSDVSGGLTLQALAVEGNATMRHVLPEAVDTYDLGSSSLLWRQVWASELQSILFVENTVQAIGGWFLVPHGQGTLAEDVDNAQTTVDFGTAMTQNDFVLLRGNNQVEYIQVGTIVSGTTYNVTRNLDGSGANDWPQGHVWVNLGYDGDGRIELDAQTGGARMSIIAQGANYNAQTEYVRIGDLNGWGSYSSLIYGAALGSYSGNEYMTYDPTNGLRVRGTIYADDGQLATLSVTGTLTLSGSGKLITAASPSPRIEIDTSHIAGYSDATTKEFYVDASDGKAYAGGGNVMLDADGITIKSGSVFDPQRAVRFTYGSDLLGYIGGKSSDLKIRANSITGVGDASMEVEVVDGGSAGDYARFFIELTHGATITTFYLNNDGSPNGYLQNADFYFTDEVAVSGGLTVGATSTSVDHTGDLECHQDARVRYGLAVGSLEFNPPDASIQLYDDGTWPHVLMGDLSCVDQTWTRLNHYTAKNIYTSRRLRVDGGITSGSLSPGAGEVYASGDIRVGGGLYVGGTGTNPDADDIHYDGNLKSMKNSTYYDVYGFCPLTTKLTSTSWDGDAKTTGSVGTIDLSSVFSAPAGIKAVLVRLAVRDETVGVHAALGPSSGQYECAFVTTQVANQYIHCVAPVPCDSNGDIYFYCSGELDNVHIQIWGYWI